MFVFLDRHFVPERMFDFQDVKRYKDKRPSSMSRRAHPLFPGGPMRYFPAGPPGARAPRRPRGGPAGGRPQGGARGRARLAF